MKVELSSRATGVVLGGDFSDPTNERLIYLSAAGLVLVGLLLLIGTILWWRRGRQEHPALAPLELMGARSWMKAPEGDRRRRLNQVRVAGAGGAASERIVGEPIDLRARNRDMPAAFDDLREPGEADVQPEELAAAEPALPEAGVPAAADVIDDGAEREATLVPTAGRAEEATQSGDAGNVLRAHEEAAETTAGEPQPVVDDEIVPVEAIASGPNDSTS